MKIRKYRPLDVRELLSLYYDTVHEINIRDYSAAQVDAWMPSKEERVGFWNERFSASKTVVAEIKGKIVGFGNLEKNNSMIGMLYVHKDHQREGIATALLKVLEKKLRKQEIFTAKAEVSFTAHPFFVSRGYQLVRENHKTLNDLEFTNYIMEKELKTKSKKSKEKKEKKLFSWPHLLTNKFFDLLIVVVGVTIAIEVNDWMKSSDRAAQEIIYKEKLRADIDKDIQEVDAALNSLQEKKQLIDRYLQNDNVPVDSLHSMAFLILPVKSFTHHQGAYQTLLLEKDPAILSNRLLRLQLAEYYSSSATTRSFEESYRALLFGLIDYTQNQSKQDSQKNGDVTVPLNNVLNNYLYAVDAQLEEAIAFYSESSKKAKALRVVLN